tara:strand:+ start:301 stop:597 length:297 start_codon:yes stop_codon:yes gene_type:complete
MEYVYCHFKIILLYSSFKRSLSAFSSYITRYFDAVFGKYFVLSDSFFSGLAHFKKSVFALEFLDSNECSLFPFECLDKLSKDSISIENFKATEYENSL